MIICHTRNKASRQAWCIVGYSNQRSIAVMNPEHVHTAGIVRTVNKYVMLMRIHKQTTLTSSVS